MADAQLSPLSALGPARYLKHAFEDQHNLVLLLGASCFSVAFASFLPLIVGVSAELVWLSVGPRLPAFREWVDRKLSTQYLARSEAAIEGALAELSTAEVRRFRALSRNVALLLANAEARLPAHELELAVHGLLELRRTFLDYSFLGQRVTALADQIPNSERELEAERLQQTYGAERELTVRMTIRNALTALQRTISQQTSLASVNRTIELRLEMLEGALLYLTGRLADPTFEQLAPEIDNALREIGPAEALELKVDEIFAQAPASAGR